MYGTRTCFRIESPQTNDAALTGTGHLFISRFLGLLTPLKNKLPKSTTRRNYVDLMKLPQWLQTLAIAAVSNLPNIIELAMIAKI